jgi:hypothetical protein
MLLMITNPVPIHLPDASGVVRLARVDEHSRPPHLGRSRDQAHRSAIDNHLLFALTILTDSCFMINGECASVMAAPNIFMLDPHYSSWRTGKNMVLLR